MLDATEYYKKQGYLSDAEAKQASINKFAETYGTKVEYIDKMLRDPNNNFTAETLGFLYEQGANIAESPPGGFPNTAEAMAKKQVYGETRGVDTFGPLNKAIQPRRYAQFGDMEPVGPRTDPGTAQIPLIRSIRDYAPGEVEAVLSTIAPPRGASPVAEDFRRNPQRAAELSPEALAREAFRPQVVKTGEQKRLEREEESRKRQLMFSSAEDILKQNPNMTPEMAILELAEQMEEQGFDLLVQQGMRQKLTPDYIRAYKMRDPISGISNLLTFGPEIQDKIIRDMARQNVQMRFREAGLEGQLEGTKFEVPIGTITRYDGLEYNISEMWKSLTVRS